MNLNKVIWYKKYTPWLFILPTIFGLLIFRLIPIFAALVLSFTRWSLLGSPKWVGFANYLEAFTTKSFFEIIGNTFEFSLIYVFGSMILGLTLAVLVNVKIKGIGAFRAIIYLPVVTSAVAVGIVWNWILGPRFGILSVFLEKFMETAPYWLTDPTLALRSVAIVQVWKMSGYYMILFLAGLQSIPRDALEAATVDGANSIQKFFRVTLPMLSPTVFFVLTITIIDSFKNFELIYSMTKGGPQNASNTLVYDVYLNAFVHYRVGYAASVAYVLFVMVGVLTILNFQVRRRWAQPLN